MYRNGRVVSKPRPDRNIRHADGPRPAPKRQRPASVPGRKRGPEGGPDRCAQARSDARPYTLARGPASHEGRPSNARQGSHSTDNEFAESRGEEGLSGQPVVHEPRPEYGPNRRTSNDQQQRGPLRPQLTVAPVPAPISTIGEVGVGQHVKHSCTDRHPDCTAQKGVLKPRRAVRGGRSRGERTATQPGGRPPGLRRGGHARTCPTPFHGTPGELVYGRDIEGQGSAHRLPRNREGRPHPDNDQKNERTRWGDEGPEPVLSAAWGSDAVKGHNPCGLRSDDRGSSYAAGSRPFVTETHSCQPSGILRPNGLLTGQVQVLHLLRFAP